MRSGRNNRNARQIGLGHAGGITGQRRMHGSVDYPETRKCNTLKDCAQGRQGTAMKFMRAAAFAGSLVLSPQFGFAEEGRAWLGAPTGAGGGSSPSRETTLSDLQLDN